MDPCQVRCYDQCMHADRRQFDDFIASLQRARDCFQQEREAILAAHPDWDPGVDARPIAFTKCVNVCDAALLSSWFLRRYLVSAEWWRTTASQVTSGSDRQRLVNAYTSFLKVGFIQVLLMAIESSTRTFQRALDPHACGAGTAGFESVYRWLLRRLDLHRWEPMMDLWCCVRNSVHNNGVFLPPSGKDRVVTFDGAEYAFNVGTLVDCAGWDTIATIVGQTHRLLGDVVRSVSIASIPAIPEPPAPIADLNVGS